MPPLSHFFFFFFFVSGSHLPMSRKTARRLCCTVVFFCSPLGFCHIYSFFIPQVWAIALLHFCFCCHFFLPRVFGNISPFLNHDQFYSFAFSLRVFVFLSSFLPFLFSLPWIKHSMSRRVLLGEAPDRWRASERKGNPMTTFCLTVSPSSPQVQQCGPWRLAPFPGTRRNFILCVCVFFFTLVGRACDQCLLNRGAGRRD